MYTKVIHSCEYQSPELETTNACRILVEKLHEKHPLGRAGR
jgi:hypothetical protein